jgi:hypothetical protein
MHVVKRNGELRLEPVNPPEDRVGNFLKEVHRGLEDLTAGPRQFEAQLRRTEQLRRERIRREAQEQAEAVAREKAMLAEMADANERARAAEEREQTNQAASDAREQEMLALTKSSLNWAKVAVAIAVLSLMVTFAVAVAA